MKAILKTNAIRIPKAPTTSEDWEAFYTTPMFDEHRRAVDSAMRRAMATGLSMYTVSFDLAKNDPLDDLAREYYDRTEAYDRSVCTGPISPSGRIIPATVHEAALININAEKLRRELTGRAGRLGYTGAQLKHAMKTHLQRSRY